MNKLGLILIAGAALFEVVADILFKYWSINSRSIFIIGGVLIYSVGTFLWAYSLRYGDLSKGITVFTVFNLIAVVLAGVFIFKEDLSTLNMVGIVLGVISVILVQI